MAQGPVLYPTQYPTYYPTNAGWGYWNKAEAMQQSQFDNRLRLRQQQEWERQQFDRNPVLDFAEQATRIRANKEQERYYRNLNEQMEEQAPRPANPFANPFLRR